MWHKSSLDKRNFFLSPSPFLAMYHRLLGYGLFLAISCGCPLEVKLAKAISCLQVPNFCTMGERFIFTNPHGDVVELDPTEDSQCVLATNGIPSEYAIRNRINVEPLPDHMLPKPGGDDTMVPDLNEEQAHPVEPTATPSQETRPSLKRKAATANLDDLELN